MGVFDRWFKQTRYRTVYGFGGQPITFDRAAYEQETVRGIIDCIASHVAKADFLHVIVDKDGRISDIKRTSPYARLLNQQPNELMSAYDLKYKLISQLENYTTAMIYVRWDGMTPKAFYPINYRQYEFLQLDDKSYAVRFSDATGTEYTLPLEDVIVLRKFYHNSDIGGDGNSPIYNTLDMIKTAEQGLSEALHISNKIRGLLKQKNALFSREDAQASAEAFSAQYEKAAQNGGVVGMDITEEYVPIATTPYSANAAQMKEIRDGLYRYFRMSENILKSDYSEGQWRAFYEAVLEPIFVKLGQAFTNACFTPTERGHGNRLICVTSTLMHASVQTKINIIREARETGLFTLNEQREMFGYPPIEGGDGRQISLNYVDADKQDQYQGTSTLPRKDKDDGEDDGEDQDDADAGAAV